MDATSTALTITPDQAEFTERQVTTLRHIGLDKATPADLAVFFHQCKRTGLDPFARQVYMIGRNVKNRDTDKWETKYTIQTGIDGYRLIARRAADRAGVDYGTEPVEWAHRDGTWRPVWSKDWGAPIGARITVHRGGSTFTGVALLDEYAQDNQMWRSRPAGMIAKCAEALALRMAFPLDLAGIYTDDEMGDPNPETGVAETRPARDEQQQPRTVGRRRPTTTGGETPAPTAPTATATTATGGETPEDGDVVDAEVVDDEPAAAWPEVKQPPKDVPIPEGTKMATRAQVTAINTIATKSGITERADKLAWLSNMVGRRIASSNVLTFTEAARVIEECGE